MYQVSKSARSRLFKECWYNLITRLVNEEGIFISFIMLALPYPLRISGLSMWWERLVQQGAS